jgi:hypothetical protein
VHTLPKARESKPLPFNILSIEALRLARWEWVKHGSMASSLLKRLFDPSLCWRGDWFRSTVEALRLGGMPYPGPERMLAAALGYKGWFHP